MKATYLYNLECSFKSKDGKAKYKLSDPLNGFIYIIISTVITADSFLDGNHSYEAVVTGSNSDSHEMDPNKVIQTFCSKDSMSHQEILKLLGYEKEE